MKKIYFAFISLLISITTFAQDENMINYDSLEQSFKYEYGLINLPGGIGKITVPKGFKYLNAKQAEMVIVDLWGNPKSENMTLGLLLPEANSILGDNYVFNIQYDEIGYVEDDDADDINYEDLLADLKKDSEEENKQRAAEGYPSITMVGWAAKPFYDKERKILHWAKEIKFGTDSINTLNYNIRVLGRKGVLVLNAISSVNQLAAVQKDLTNVLDIVKFNDGFKYEDYDSSVDKVAAWTIGGLVAGKVLAKVGMFALLAKFWKLIIFGVIGFFGFIWKKIKGQKEEEVTYNSQTGEPSAEIVEEQIIEKKVDSEEKTDSDSTDENEKKDEEK